MVHRKSTYKLTFKNFNNQTRKLIWEENVAVRERRRNDERSHHSIDQSDSECECDYGNSNYEGYSKDIKRVAWKENTTENNYSTDTSKLKPSSHSSIQIDERFQLENEEPKKWHIVTDNTSTPICHTCSSRDDFRMDTHTTKTSYTSDSSRPKTVHKRESTTQTEEEKESDTWPRVPKGVMKLSPFTGEFDLIPSRKCEVEKTGTSGAKDRTSRQKPWRRAGSALRFEPDVINIRPRVGLLSSGLRRSESRPEMDTVGTEMTLCTRDVINRREVMSLRKEPRVSHAHKSNPGMTGSECLWCGENMAFRGVMT